MGFKNFLVFFLLLSVQFHPLLALSQTSLPDPFMTADSNQEQDVTEYKSVPKRLTMLVKLGDNQNITVVNKRGGAAGGHGGGHGAGRGSVGGARGSGGGKKSPYTQGGVVIPLYAAGATNHPRVSNSHGSNGGTLSYVPLDYLILAFFASFFLVLF
ncbi:WAS/WASL-interacting protein family member 1-like [Herrania umbratica]|uniref:WAS/WASL-interacting protein family member 1-like n=1 Tax=Herrania umbratica TaxID=108875 RepID=A0A6J0ZWQ6_9ROSI|nr:WAS/WASL-interacting protein family member 1-like [Herrania umbratica]